MYCDKIHELYSPRHESHTHHWVMQNLQKELVLTMQRLVEEIPNARKTWVPTGKIPKVWAIAVFGAWRWASSSYGHVAIVEKVIDHNKILVSDMNYAGRNRVTTRITSSHLALWYIYTLTSDETTDASPNKTNLINVQLSISDINLELQAWSIHMTDQNSIVDIYQDDVTIYQTDQDNLPYHDHNQNLSYTDNHISIDNRQVIKNISKQYRVRIHTAMMLWEHKANAAYWDSTS
jgi:hypothetical protein